VGDNAGVRAGAPNDEVIVRIVVERLVVTVDQPAEVVEATVRAELEQRRMSARVQAFVPIFAERAARRRLAGLNGRGPR
jgi:hypothetical protein